MTTGLDGFAAFTGGEHIPMTPQQLMDTVIQEGLDTLPDPLEILRHDVIALCYRAELENCSFPKWRIQRIMLMIDRLVPTEVEDVESMRDYIEAEQPDDGEDEINA